MNLTTTVTAKNQITVPKFVREKTGIKTGVKIDLYPTNGGFVGRIRKLSNIQKFFGDLKYLDDGRPLNEVRSKAKQMETNRIIKKLNLVDKIQFGNEVD